MPLNLYVSALSLTINNGISGRARVLFNFFKDPPTSNQELCCKEILLLLFGSSICCWAVGFVTNRNLLCCLYCYHHLFEIFLFV